MLSLQGFNSRRLSGIFAARSPGETVAALTLSRRSSNGALLFCSRPVRAAFLFAPFGAKLLDFED
jgi:hypothetical protein